MAELPARGGRRLRNVDKSLTDGNIIDISIKISVHQ